MKNTCVLLFVLMIKGCLANEIVNFRYNASVVSGDTLRLTCEVRDDGDEDYVEWREYVDNPDPLGVRIALNSDVTHVNASKYEIVGQFDLLIKNTTTADGGTYGCKQLLGPDVNYRTEVVVFDPAQCSAPIELVEEEQAEIECLSAYGGHFTPQVGLHVAGKKLDSVIVSNGTGYTNLSLRVSTSRKDNGRNYICKVSLESPTYHDNCTTSLSVLYSVRDVTIQPDVDVVSIGAELICSADAHPTPQFIWNQISPSNGGRVRGPSLPVMTNMAGTTQEWRCTAQNTIRTNSTSASVSKVFQVRATMVENSAVLSRASVTAVLVLSTMWLH